MSSFGSYSPEDALRLMYQNRAHSSPHFLGPPVQDGGGYQVPPVRPPKPPRPPGGFQGPGQLGPPIHQGGQGFQMPKDKSERRAAYSHDKDYARALQAAMKRRQQAMGGTSNAG